MPTELKTEAKRKKRWGDRREGRKLRTLLPMTAVFPYVCPRVSGCVNYIKDSLNTEQIDRYIREKSAAGLKGFSLLHVLVAAYVRTLASHPALNRFISKETIYARYNIDVCMTIKRELALNADETCIKIRLRPDCTAEDVYALFNAEINEYREGSNESGFDGAAKVLGHVPGFMLRLAMAAIRFMDRHDLLPASLIKASPFHGSMFITSMGSLGIPAIYHHLYEFGNCPIFISYGAKRRSYEVTKDGTVVKRTYIDYTVSADDRICDGHYYASALKTFKAITKKPWLLDKPPENITEDIE